MNHQIQISEKEAYSTINVQRKLTGKIIRKAKRNFHKNTREEIEENFNCNKSRDYYKTFGRYVKKYKPPTLILKDENGNMGHNNAENSKILTNAFEKTFKL